MPDRISRRTLLTIGAAALTTHRVAAEDVRSTIVDDAGHEMPYLWRPAADPRNARTLVLLHGHGTNTRPLDYHATNWNILAPLDRYGYQGKGSWWLGEDGDYFTLALLHRLVKRVRSRSGGDRGLYVAGSSMGGYGALLHGMLLGAKAVYANAFQSRLSGTAFTDAMPAIAVVGATGPEADLRRYVRGKSRLPRFFLDFNLLDHADLDYAQDHFLPFLAALADAGAYGKAEVFPIADHSQQRSFAEMLALFG